MNNENDFDNRNLLPTLFLESLASCHAITYVNGNLVGDPLDVKMFQSTGWILDEMHDKQSEEQSHDQSYIA